MRTKVLLVCSLGLNLALVAALRMDRKPAAKASGLGVAPANPTAAPPVLRLSKTNIILGSVIGFSWRDVESPDYPVYIRNLRGVGCPESTLRDIIVADVNQLFTRKRLSYAPTNDVAWWRSDADLQRQAAEAAIRSALDLERRVLLTNLLGAKWDLGAWQSQPAPVALAGPVLGALSPETQQLVRSVHAGMTEKLAAARRENGGAGPVALARIEQEARAQLALALSPDQLEEFQLRYSPAAARLRQQFTGFELPPEQFRSLLKAVENADARALRAAGETGPLSPQDLETQRQAAIRGALPRDRYALWTLQQNPAFQEAAATAARLGASPQAALTLFEISQAALSERERIESDPALSDEERLLELADLETQEARARDLALGKTPKPDPETAAASQPPLTYRTGPYETVAHISLQYGIPMGVILQANPGIDFNHLGPGTEVVIPRWNAALPPIGWVPTAPARR